MPRAPFNPIPQADQGRACAACAEWLAAHGAVLTGDTADPVSLAVDCKASAPTLAVPTDTGAVAHGDANLAVDDFLKSAVGPA